MNSFQEKFIGHEYSNDLDVVKRAEEAKHGDMTKRTEGKSINDRIISMLM